MEMRVRPISLKEAVYRDCNLAASFSDDEFFDTRAHVHVHFSLSSASIFFQHQERVISLSMQSRSSFFRFSPQYDQKLNVITALTAHACSKQTR